MISSSHETDSFSPSLSPLQPVELLCSLRCEYTWAWCGSIRWIIEPAHETKPNGLLFRSIKNVRFSGLESKVRVVRPPSSVALLLVAPSSSSFASSWPPPPPCSPLPPPRYGRPGSVAPFALLRAPLPPLPRSGPLGDDGSGRTRRTARRQGGGSICQAGQAVEVPHIVMATLATGVKMTCPCLPLTRRSGT